MVKPNAVVLTERLANKYFGEQDPVGKVLGLPQAEDGLEVTGACANVPENSHLRFDLLVSSSSLDLLNDEAGKLFFKSGMDGTAKPQEGSRG